MSDISPIDECKMAIDKLTYYEIHGVNRVSSKLVKSLSAVDAKVLFKSSKKLMDNPNAIWECWTKFRLVNFLKKVTHRI